MKRTYAFTGKTVERYARRFCSEDISLIENYELAKADNFIGWCIHHRLEYLPCQQRWVSSKELIAKGIYYGRPAWELVFMKRGDHARLHSKDPNWKAKTSEAAKQTIKKAQKAHRKPLEIDGIRFERQEDAAKHFNVGRSTIRRWLRNPEKYNRVCRYL